MGRATAAVPGLEAIPGARVVPAHPVVELVAAPAALPLGAGIDVPARRATVATRGPVTKRAVGGSVVRMGITRSAPVGRGVTGRSVVRAATVVTVRAATVRSGTTVARRATARS